ncbi:MAG: restriction endonuclease [Spirochaetes bacterium]|nr:restriction endonuclease [Spirochaetota bacterium]
MPIPDFQSIMLPLLQTISDGNVHDYKEVKLKLIDIFKVSEYELKELLPSGRAYLFDNRAGWANTYLKKAGLIQSSKRGTLQITDEGIKVLKTNPEKVNVKLLKTYDSFKEFHTMKKEDESEEEDGESYTDTKSPEEILEDAHETLVSSLSQELLDTIKKCSPQFFEKLVVDLLIKMGYGGSRRDAGKAIGKSGDGGIDGIINEDRLGLDTIYLQAKRWDNSVPVKEIRDFAGSLLSKKARKGIFITTSSFPKSAYEFAESIEPKIILIDGDKLCKLMIEHNVGINVKSQYEIKSIDSDYFEE